ncbi:CBS domain-containing protein [Shewanella gaetbuli]|uniref:CBS domain-containing protein n=1 Tax=Shewanella gaetbuli TaxID=220752 RepID=A0A9X1ZPZ6_9GAMM|nr:CBS domain-containing protein [Shewanella gaetbuli]MCL1143970.1 CBS domain-containing protein [Shewanella gaetbuli]
MSATITLVRHIMVTRLVTISMDDRLTVAKHIFDNVHFHHLLVVDEHDQLQGVLSHRDFLKALSPNLGTAAELVRDTETLNRRVHQVMTHDPICISADANIKQATQLILQHNIGSLPVKENGKLVGIITWKDLLKAYCSSEEA